MQKQVRKFVGPGGLARHMGISETRVRQINPEPDALVDNRPAWDLQTADRLKAEREQRLRDRAARRARP